MSKMSRLMPKNLYEIEYLDGNEYKYKKVTMSAYSAAQAEFLFYKYYTKCLLKSVTKVLAY